MTKERSRDELLLELKRLHKHFAISGTMLILALSFIMLWSLNEMIHGSFWRPCVHIMMNILLLIMAIRGRLFCHVFNTFDQWVEKKKREG
jgi:hypothetical protein